MKFSHGDYVMVEAFKLEPPHDTDSEGELPMPIAGIVSDDTSSWTSSSTTQESVDELHLEDTYMSDALIIYRPLGRTLRPPYLIQAMHTTHINNLVIVMQHWQDLRYQPWRIECVHPTYGADYPQSDETHIYVVVALCDLQSPLHQVVLNVVQTLDTTLQRALPLPPHVDRDDILQANRLQGFCRRPQHTCRVYKNGQLLIEGDRRTVTHGDYIRTTITNVLDEDTERNMADSFQVSAQAEGLEHLDETGLAMLDNGRNGEPNIVDNRPRPSQASSSRGPSEQLMEIDEGNAMVPDRADYWIYMATIMYVAAMMLSRQMYHPVIKGKLKRKQRRLDKAPSNGKILRTLAFTYLIVGAEALSINVREGRLSTERQFDDIEPSMMQNYIDSTLPYTYLVCREPLTGLPPPGNTKTEEKTYISLSTSMQESFLHQSRTATMDQIVARICLLLESISLSRKISAAQKDFQKKHGAIQISLSKALQICTEPRQHTGPLVERTFEQIDTVQSTCGVQRPKGTHAHIAPAIRIDPGKVPRVYLPIATSEPNDRNGLEGFEVAPDNPEYLTRIDTGVEGRQHDVFSFETDIDILNDEYGLVNSWDLPARPDPLQLTLELHPSTTEKLLHPCTAPESHDTWFIFTDGSAGKCDQGWSFAIFSGRQSEGVHGAVQLVDWGGGYTDSDPLSHTWLGAVEDSIKSGESEAIMWAILWVLQAHQTYHERKVEIYSDSLTVLNAADGTWGGRDDDSLTLRLRALYHLLWAVRHGRDLCIHHIRGHQGNYGNELVDVLANAIRKGSLESRVPNINISHWFHGTTPNIVFAWLPFDTDRRAEETLQFQRGKLCWTPLNLPKPELQWLKTSKVKRDDQHQHYTLRLRIGSYNVGSIKEKGRTALLREQAEHFGFHALGLQETRTSIDDPVQSNYARIISVAQQGIGGCELWLSTTLAYATAKQERSYFRRENAQVVYADSQLLLVVYHDHQLRLLFCVAHAPHSGQAPQTVQSWWANTTKQIQRYLQDNHLILLIDANADPPLHLPHVGALRPTERDKLRKGDTAFGTFLAQFGLLAPSTHQDYHYGEQITWISNDGSKTARDDYICIPVTWMEFALSSTVCQHMDSGVDGFDHLAVQLDVQGILLGPTESQQPTFDRTKIMKADKEAGKRLFAEAIHVPWSTDVTTHAYIVEQHLHTKLAEQFPVDKKRRRKPYVQ